MVSDAALDLGGDIRVKRTQSGLLDAGERPIPEVSSAVNPAALIATPIARFSRSTTRPWRQVRRITATTEPRLLSERDT
jgi:hypothetical protein